MQNRSETEGQLLFTATGETANTELIPTNSVESDNIGFPTATPQTETRIVWLILLM